MEEEIQIIEQVKYTNPRASIPMVFEVFSYKNPKSLISEESGEILVLSDQDEEITQDLSKPTLDKEDVEAKELQKENWGPEPIVKNKRVKRKLEDGDSKVKRENSKKAYLRRVQEYKKWWREQKVQMVIVSLSNTP